MELLPVLILCGVIALQVVHIVRLRRALFASNDQRQHYRRLFSEIALRESILRAVHAQEQLVYDEYMRAHGAGRRVGEDSPAAVAIRAAQTAARVARVRQWEGDVDAIRALDRPLTHHEFERVMHEAAPPARPDPPFPEDHMLVRDMALRDRILRIAAHTAEHRNEAEARGVAWLKSCLSPEQLQDYDRTRSFVVIGGTSGRRYRICWGTSQNIIRLETSVDGREVPVERLCFGPRGVPIGDVLLHQKIALEGDEGATLRIAGRTPVPIMGQATGMGPDGPVSMDPTGQITRQLSPQFRWNVANQIT